MLISPPFLPTKQENQTDENWLNLAMSGGRPGDGFFPISFDLGWHGGMHLTAPLNGNVSQRVRAIADGTVVFKRAPVARQDDINHPQNYRGGWTDNGCVVIRHDTAIGDGQNAAAVSFFSIYMHLSELHPSIKDGRRIYRKDDLGQAGQIYGDTNRKIHFEIVCDDANLRKLAGRISGDVDITENGRTDAVYGEIYFTLSVGTQIFPQLPLPQLVSAHIQPPKPNRTAPLPPLVALAVKHTTTEVLVIGMRHATGAGALERRGDTYFSTYKLDGSNVGSELRDVSGEYQLYSTATSISKAFPAASQPAPSAVYELLRFGRIINTAHETLTPADVPHWRQVNYPGGTGWVNLNVAGITKFSDADFPHWRGWKFIDDSQDLDSHCDSTIIKNLLDISGNGKVDPIEAAVALNDSAVTAKLEKTICKFPSEWQTSTIDQRWSWLKTQSEENPVPLTEEDFTELKAHITALCFSLPALDTALWHWNPLQFIKHFRTCGWLSLREMAQLIPRKSVAAGVITWVDANERLNVGYIQRGQPQMPAGLDLAINVAFRKYCLASSCLRQAHFFGQAFVETGALRLNTEGGNDRYFRTMYEVITPAEAGEDYDDRPRVGHGGSIAWRLGMVYHTVNHHRVLMTRNEYMAARPGIVHTKAQSLGNTQAGDGPRFRGRGLIQLTGRTNYASYSTYRGHNYTNDPNPPLLAGDAFVSVDVSLKYWISKERHGMNINRHADAGSNDAATEQVTRAVNGGTTHIEHRREYFNYVWGLLQDNPTPADTRTLERQKE